MEPSVAKQKQIQKTFKQLFFNVLIFTLLIGLTFFFVFKDQDIGEAIAVFNNAKFGYVITGIFLMLLYFSMEAWNIYSLLRAFGEKLSFFQALKFTFIGFFFCSVTPGASGGQPLEIYYMTKEKISGAHATMALLIQICGVQVAVLALGIFGLLINIGKLESSVISLGIIGLIINGVALAILLIGVFSKRLTKKIVEFGLSVIKFFGYKKIEQKRESINNSLEQYSNSAKFIKTHKKQFALCILRSVLQMIIYFLIPFFVYKALGLKGTSIFEIFFLQAVLFMATSGLPLPGAVGASEAVFLSIYGVIFGEDFLGGAVLLNRSISFYWFVLVSMMVVFMNIIRLRASKKIAK
ncbi:flippase-like domain-containing protein [Candidatus Saccharibacteria bacterium]|nr:flippase-like domain-containing protein [Candidatus Saccharibacteria bacterium]